MSPPELILASASPRRRHLLESAGYGLVVRIPHADESPLPRETGADLALRLAMAKGRAALHGMEGDLPSLPVLAADTVVHQDADIFPKPLDPEDAVRILTRLSGAWHQVTTGFCVLAGDRILARRVTTRVLFRPLGAGEIRRYVATGEPLDKAGAYGIQGAGGALVQALDGSYTNVVGLPLEEVMAALQELGVPRPL